jgi:hypothetical protein
MKIAVYTMRAIATFFGNKRLATTIHQSSTASTTRIHHSKDLRVAHQANVTYRNVKLCSGVMPHSSAKHPATRTSSSDNIQNCSNITSISLNSSQLWYSYCNQGAFASWHIQTQGSRSGMK